MVNEGITGDVEIRILSDLKYIEQLNKMTSLLFKYTPFKDKDITWENNGGLELEDLTPEKIYEMADLNCTII